MIFFGDIFENQADLFQLNKGAYYTTEIGR